MVFYLDSQILFQFSIRIARSVVPAVEEGVQAAARRGVESSSSSHGPVSEHFERGQRRAAANRVGARRLACKQRCDVHARLGDVRNG